MKSNVSSLVIKKKIENMNSTTTGEQKCFATSTAKKKTATHGKSMQKSKTPRQRFLENLKKGDKVWIVPVKFYSNAYELTWQETFDGWFDFNGSSGEYCLLECVYDGALKFPTAHIFPTKKAAKLFAAPLKIDVINKRLQQIKKEETSLYKEWDKLEDLLAKQ